MTIRCLYTVENAASVLSTTVEQIRLLAKLQILPVACEEPLRFDMHALDQFKEHQWATYKHIGFGRRKGIWAD